MHIPPSVSSRDLSAARAWINAAEDFQHPTLLAAYETSLRLLVQHLVTLPSLPQHLAILKCNVVTSSRRIFCLRKYTPALAVELLEQGWAVFWN